MKWLIFMLFSIPAVAQVVTPFPQPGAGPGMSQKAPPDVVLPVGCSMSNLAGCVPLYTGDEPLQTDFVTPMVGTPAHALGPADCPTWGTTPSVAFTYPGDSGANNRVWCPNTMTDIFTIFSSANGGSATSTGGVHWQQGDILALQSQGPTGTVQYTGYNDNRCMTYITTWPRRTVGLRFCGISFPQSIQTGPLKKISYVITINYAQLPPAGTRISTGYHQYMAKMVATDNNNGGSALYFGPRANNWRVVGIEFINNTTYGSNPPFFAGFSQSLIELEAWNTRNGKRDLWARTDGTSDCVPTAVRNVAIVHMPPGNWCDFLGAAVEVTTAGMGAILSVSPSTLPVGSQNVNIVITTQDSHMCDDVIDVNGAVVTPGNVTCASVHSTVPTYVTFGYHVFVHSNTVANVPCPAMVTNPSSTCQTLTSNVTVDSDALSLRVGAAGNLVYTTPGNITISNQGETAVSNSTIRTPIITTHRANAGYPDEFMMKPAGLILTDPTVPTVASIQNVNNNGYPILLVNTGASLPQPLKIMTTGTHMLTTTVGCTQPCAPGGITGTEVGFANGSMFLNSTTAPTVASDTEVDVTVATTTATGGRWGTAVIQGNTRPFTARVPVALDANVMNGNGGLFVIPSTNPNSWIQSIDCYNMLPGETYTCNVVGAHTSWVQGHTTFRFAYNSLPDGTDDIKVANPPTIVDSTHATIVVSLDPTAGAGADHIMFDRIDAHGDIMPYTKNTFGGTAPNGWWLWEPTPPTGGVHLVRDAIVIQGKYVGIRDSIAHDTMNCSGAINPTTNLWCGILEAHPLADVQGPGPKWIYNSAFWNGAELTLTGGAGNSELSALNAFVQDNVFIRNHWYNTDSYMPVTVDQYAQDERVSNTNGLVTPAYPITHLTVTFDPTGTHCGSPTGPAGSPGCLNGTTGAQPTGWTVCPKILLAAVAGATAPLPSTFGCTIDASGHLAITFGNGGSGYTTAPGLVLSFPGLSGVKNLLEHKGIQRALYYGNIAANIWGTGFQAQYGIGVLLNVISGYGSNNYYWSGNDNVYYRDNWFDDTWQTFIVGGLTACNAVLNMLTGGAPGWLATPFACATPNDPWSGFNTDPTIVRGGYGTAFHNGNQDNIHFENNLSTMRDISTELTIIPSRQIFSSFQQSHNRGMMEISSQTNLVMRHNTLVKRPQYTLDSFASIYLANPNSSPADKFSFYPSQASPTLPSSSTLWNSYIWSNVMGCMPAMQLITSPNIVREFSCPTAQGATPAQACPATLAGGGYKAERHFLGNLFYDSQPSGGPSGGNLNGGGCQSSSPAGTDWTFGQQTNNVRQVVTPGVDTQPPASGQPQRYAWQAAGAATYIRGQRPGDWTLTDPAGTAMLSGSGNLALPDNKPPGIDNTELMAAIGQTTPADIPMVITGDWSGAVIPVFFSISGTVTGVSGVSMGLQPGNMTTTATPGYIFNNVPENGVYTITPTLSGCTFVPPSITTPALVQNLTGQDFTANCAAPTFSISGTVTGATGVTITLTPGNVTQVAAPGFTFTGLAAGSYTLTPSLTGYTFTPPSATETITNVNVTGVSFTASPVVGPQPVQLNVGRIGPP